MEVFNPSDDSFLGGRMVVEARYFLGNMKLITTARIDVTLTIHMMRRRHFNQMYT